MAPRGGACEEPEVGGTVRAGAQRVALGGDGAQVGEGAGAGPDPAPLVRDETLGGPRPHGDCLGSATPSPFTSGVLAGPFWRLYGS